MKKIAIVYDRVNKWGGAERVLLAFHEIFPDAPLYTAVYDAKTAPWAEVFPEVIPTFLQNITFAKGNHEFLGALTPIAFESFNFDQFDLVISVTSEAAKGIITKPETLHFCYCLTPTRYLWSGYNEYLTNVPSKLAWIPFYKLIARPILSYVRGWDKIAANRPDKYIAISTAVQKRIKKYYKRDSEIMFPPVNTEMFREDKNTTSLPSDVVDAKNYYLFVSRLIPYKKADIAIKAFNHSGKKLVIIGTGSEEKRLKKLAKGNIEFIPWVSDKELATYYQNAKALIFPGEEDFGIVMVEALASGTPVIAYKKGGALDIVKDGITGVFFDKQNVTSLISAIEKFEKIKFNKKTLIENSKKFSKEIFKNEISKLVAKL